MTIFELADELENEVHRIVRDAAEKTAQAVRQQTPANKVRTREAVFFTANQTQAVVGLKFGEKYPAAGTPTQERFGRQLSVIRPLTRQYVIDRLNKFLKAET